MWSYAAWAALWPILVRHGQASPAADVLVVGAKGTLQSAALTLLKFGNVSSATADDVGQFIELEPPAELTSIGRNTAVFSASELGGQNATPALLSEGTFVKELGGQNATPALLSEGTFVKETALPVGHEPTSDSTACFVAYVTLYACYSAWCWVFELRAIQQADSKRSQEALQSSKPVKDRIVEWDFMKAVMLFFVMVLHTGRNGWKQGGLSDGEQTFFLMLAPFPMPVFAFVSGVFGASIERKAMLKTLCYTLGTFFLAKILGAAVIVVSPGPRSFEELRDVGFLVFWYLKSLFVWRFTVTPLFHFFRKNSVPGPVAFATVFMVCYLLRHLGLPHWTHEWIFFAPYYAQGLLLAPERWLGLFVDRRLLCTSIAFLVFWCVSLIVSPWFRDWNDVACANGFLQCPNSHWPDTMRFNRRTPSFSSFSEDVHIYALQDSLSMAVSCIVACCARPLEALAPKWATVLYGCGTRTLYGYVLHFIFFLHFGVRMGVHFPAMPGWLWGICTVIIAFQVLLVFCSSLTEHLFSWVIMPFWMMRICEQPKS